MKIREEIYIFNKIKIDNYLNEILFFAHNSLSSIKVILQHLEAEIYKIKNLSKRYNNKIERAALN